MKKCCNSKNEEIAILADFLRIISEENRLRIICFLRSGEQCVCKIWQHLDLPQNLTSHHLKVLKDFELLNSRKSGLNIYYSLNEKELNKYQQMLEKLNKSQGEKMKVKILGTGCPNCKKLQSNTEKAVNELGLEAEVIKVEEMEEIVAYGVMSLPALVVDEKVLFSGRIPSVQELKSLLSDNRDDKAESKGCCSCQKGCCQ